VPVTPPSERHARLTNRNSVSLSCRSQIGRRDKQIKEKQPGVFLELTPSERPKGVSAKKNWKGQRTRKRPGQQHRSQGLRPRTPNFNSPDRRANSRRTPAEKRRTVICQNCGREGHGRKKYPGACFCDDCWQLTRDADYDVTEDTPYCMVIHNVNCGCNECLEANDLD
jgi:hypothetical protein